MVLDDEEEKFVKVHYDKIVESIKRNEEEKNNYNQQKQIPMGVKVIF